MINISFYDYDVNKIKFIQSYRMRILKELYDHMLDEKWMLASLEIDKDKYEENKVYLEMLEDEKFIKLDIWIGGKETASITTKGINEIERYMIENKEYLKSGNTAFDLHDMEFDVFVKEDIEPVTLEETAYNIDKIKDQIEIEY